jgi:transcriptional regulator with XRE-family HTH domain
VLFLAIKYTIGLRVTAVEEEEGLDIGEHGGEAYTGLPQHNLRRNSLLLKQAEATHVGRDFSPPAHSGQANKLEIAIGSQIRSFAKKMDLTIAELANLANLSIGMLSKIENGNASPSLSTLQSLSDALNIPVTAFFRKYEERRNASFVKAGQGLVIERAEGPAPATRTNCSATASANPFRWNPISSR